MFKRILISLTAIIVITPVVLAAFFVFNSPPASADLPYDSNNLMSDQIFTNSSSMNWIDIQNFLNAQNSGLKNYSDVENCSTIKTPYSFNYYPHCGSSVSAAVIIYDAGQAYGVNPQAIIATLQKEQSLITTPNPSASQINCAMGYSSCSGFSGFFSQVDNGTWQFRTYIELMNNRNWWGYSPSSYPCKNATSLYSAGLYPGNMVTFANPGGSARTVTLANSATAALYCYTPYVGPYNQTGYSGSYNFVISFEQWFGSTTSPGISLGRDAGSPIALSGRQDGRLEMFGIASNDGIYARIQSSQNSSSWDSWIHMSGGLRNIAAETDSNGRIQLIGVASNGGIYTTFETSASSNNWADWTHLDGGLDNAALARNYDGSLEAFGVTNIGSIYFAHEPPGSTTWGDWSPLSGGLKKIAADTNGDGRIQLVGIASNGSVYTTSQTTVNSDSWSSWTQLDGALSNVSIARNVDGSLEIIGTASNGSIYSANQLSPGSSTWSSWVKLSGGLRNIAAEGNYDGRIQLAGIASNGSVYVAPQTTVNTNTWSAWSPLDGGLRQY
jgi:hypothetical protein